MKKLMKSWLQRTMKIGSLMMVGVLLTGMLTAYAGTAEEVKKDPSHIMEEGTVSDIQENKEGWSITVENDNMGMIFHVKESISVVLQKNGEAVSLKDIKKGTVITAVVDAMAPMTMSIPPQTSGAVALILNGGKGPVDLSFYQEWVMNTENGAVKADATGDTYVPLREMAEAKGYKVEWTSHKEPIKLTKDDKVLKVTIGSKAFDYTHMTKDLQPLDRLEGLNLLVKLDAGKTMVPKSLVDALL